MKGERMRVSKRDLDLRLDYLARRHGIKLSLDWAYGGVRVCNESQSRDLSVRGTKKEAYRWLNAFICALDGDYK